MKGKIFLGFTFFFFMATSGSAQTKTVTSVQQVWTAYCNQSRFSHKWGAWLDLHVRTKEDFFNRFSQAIARAGLTYYLNDATKLTIGDSYVRHFPSDNHKKISQPEHRPWQQLQWHTSYPRLKTMQWVRLEERFRRKILNDSTLAKGNHFNFRVRYNFLLQVPLGNSKIKAGDFSFILNDEVHVNFGKQVVYNTFDQNRFFVGLAYHVNAHDNLQFGYMNVFQQLASGTDYRSTHAARVFYFHTIDWRKP
jgi:hypothetical protein